MVTLVDIRPSLYGNSAKITIDKSGHPEIFSLSKNVDRILFCCLFDPNVRCIKYD